jgi:hypothetical protein
MVPALSESTMNIVQQLLNKTKEKEQIESKP